MTAVTAEVFHIVAEPTRRAILSLLAAGERPVNDLVAHLRMAQPAVSKHLRVLRDAGLVTARRDGRRRLYDVDARNLKPVHDWVSTFERFWDTSLERIRDRAESES